MKKVKIIRRGGGGGRKIFKRKKIIKGLGSTLKSTAKEGVNWIKKHPGLAAKAAIYGAGAVGSAYTGNPGPMATAHMLAGKTDALFSRRNRSSGTVSAKPTGAKGY